MPINLLGVTMLSHLTANFHATLSNVPVFPKPIFYCLHMILSTKTVSSNFIWDHKSQTDTKPIFSESPGYILTQYFNLQHTTLFSQVPLCLQQEPLLHPSC